MIEASPQLAILIPLVGGCLILATSARRNLREAVTLLTAGLLFATVIALIPAALDGPSPAVEVLHVFPEIPLAFHVEPLGMIYALVASGLWILNSIYSIGYMRANREAHQTRFYLCFALSIASVMGIAFSANMLTLFMCYEVLSLVTYPLVMHKAPKPGVVRAGRTYLGILVSASVLLMLPAMVGTWMYTGTLDFVHGGVFGEALSNGSVPPWLFGFIFFLFMYGIAKAALMPLHRWLPAAMVAPTPVSALLHAVAVVKAGVFSVCKISTYLIGVDKLVEFGQGGWLLYAAGTTVIVASFIALFQDNLKRRLAYSTVSQLSYITMGVALFNPLGMMAAAMHIAAHAFGKITLFFAAGSIYTAANKTEISQLDGIGRRMPFTMGAFTIGCLSMIGLPPTAGFVSKWMLFGAAWTTEQYFAIGVLLLSTLLNAAYFLPIVYRAFFRAPPPPPVLEGDASHPAVAHGEAPWPIVVALTGTAACAVTLFFYPSIFADLALALVKGMPT